MSDAEWALIVPLMPTPKRTSAASRYMFARRIRCDLLHCNDRVPMAHVTNDFPPVSTVRSYFYAWRDDGLLDEMNRKLGGVARLAEGRQAQLTAGIIDGQSVKTTESGGVRGHDAGKRIKGRKRYIVTDTVGLLVGLVVHSAGIQDRDGAPEVLKAIVSRYPSLRHIFADGFEVLPRRWVVERTFAWLN